VNELDFGGCHFEYAGINSRLYGLIFANATTSRVVKIAGDGEPQTIYDRRNHRKYFIGNDYSEAPIVFEAEIISESEIGLEQRMRREIERWLFCQNDYQKLYIDPVDDIFGDTVEIIDGFQKRLYLNCRFVNAEKLEYNGGIVGYKFTVECDSRMAWQDSITKVFELDLPSEGSTGLVLINPNTDINDYTYPRVNIQMGERGGRLLIYNNSDSEDRFVRFENLDPNIEFEMNGEINYISGDNYSKFQTHNFPRMLDGENKFTIIGNVAKISFEWQNRRFI
jgi:hypothetical protein